MNRLRDLSVDYPDFFSLVDVWNEEQLAPVQIFDNVVMAATKGCSCFIIDTDEGLILLDAMLPVDACYENIVGAIGLTGKSLSDLRLIVITHGHFDHTGTAGRLARESGAEICFPADDLALWRSESNLTRARTHVSDLVCDFEPDRLLSDGDDITLGNTHIRCIATPGHTKGCLSYVLNVSDRGEEHTALLMGGTLPQKNPDDIATQLASLDLLDRLTDDARIDVELSNHHPLQCGALKIEICRNRLCHLPNPFIVGTKGIHDALDAYRRLCRVFLEKL